MSAVETTRVERGSCRVELNCATAVSHVGGVLEPVRPMPDAVFGSSSVVVQLGSSAAYTIDAKGALFGCLQNATSELIPELRTTVGELKCEYAANWADAASKTAAAAAAPDPARDADWSFQSVWPGKLSGNTEKVDGPVPALPLGVLSDTSRPIVGFGEARFFEDELSDFGLMSCSAKVRVHDDFCFILLRCECRMDRVQIRSIDTRVFLTFDRDVTDETTAVTYPAKSVLREQSYRAATWAALEGRGVNLGAGGALRDGVVGGHLLTVEDEVARGSEFRRVVE